MALVREPAKQGKLLPKLGLFTAIALIAGSMIGSGIFRLPGPMMARVQDPTMLLLVWAVGGLFTICGALTFAELAGMFPKAGGQYVFLRESVGRRWAFLYGWTLFWVIQTGIIASVAYIFAEFNQNLFGFGNEWIPIIAVACILVLSVVNYIGVRFGGAVTNVFTVAKVIGILGLVLLGFILGTPEHATFDQTVSDAPQGFLLFIAFFVAMLSALFAFDGWPQAAYVSSEIKDSSRNVPRAMIIGVLSVTVVYLLATLVYIYLLSAPDIVAIGQPDSGQRIASEAARAFAGPTGVQLISAVVIISTFGTVNAFILTSPRIFYAAAKDGLLWRRPFARIHPKFNTPNVAIIYQGIWAGLLVVLGSIARDAYVALVEAVTFAIWVFYIPAIIGYFLLRKRRPDLPRPYRTAFYPVVPIVFLVAAFLVTGTFLFSNLFTLFTTDLTTSELAGLSGIWGTVLILTGLPVLLWWRWQEKKGRPNPISEPIEGEA